MNVIQEIDRINAREMAAGVFGGITNGSWHDKYRDSAWVYLGGLSYELSEGDILCFMSQWGEIEDINVVRDKATGKSMGFAFIKYDDQRSTILAVDNFNGIKLLGRSLRCDHVDQYRLPKEVRERNEQLLDENPEAELEIGPGHAYDNKELANQLSIADGINMWGKVKDDRSDDEQGIGQFRRGLKETDDDGDSRRGSKKQKTEKKHKKSKSTEKKEKKNKKEKMHKKSSRDESEIHDAVERSIKRYSSSDVVPSNDLPMPSGQSNKFGEFVISQPDQSKPSRISSTSSSVVGFGGASLSWRGVRDPSIQPGSLNQAPGKDSRSPAVKSTYRPPELTGFGGMARLR